MMRADHPTLAFFAAYDRMPGGAPSKLDEAWRSWQRLLAKNLLPIGGIGLGLLGVSLVASPAAIVVDRRRRARLRAEEELERMQRDAHDKVYNRLSALSKRIAAASDTTTNGTAGCLAVIAEDIRATVGDLQEVLGDDVEHTSSALASVPLHDQLAAVCGAQAARLGIEVTCSMSESVPDVPAEIGWDLQCVVEEAINNAVRHGSATTIRVDVEADEVQLRLVVSDDGSGSTVERTDEAAPVSTGLRGMQHRIGRRGGVVAVSSAQGGTTVSVLVPIPQVRPGAGDDTV
jgi:signal transduction histidine kinase